MFFANKDRMTLLFLLLVAAASAADIWADLHQGVNRFHLLQEAVLLSATLLAFLWIAHGLRQKSRELKALKQTLEDIRNLPRPETQAVIRSKKLMAEAIDSQFKAWDLSQSEQEVGMLLLKGFSLKEIAALRGTTEKTIRQQASAIYRKSGLSGRHVLSAWFIDELVNLEIDASSKKD